MQTINIISKIKQIDAIVARYQDLIDENDLMALQDKSKLAKIADIERKEEETLNKKSHLTIGIIGRVKAGKSSLLNSLLFAGDDVLPKAATPMTASLTTLCYAEKPKITVEWFNKEDINKLQEEHNKFKNSITIALEAKVKDLQDKNKPIDKGKLEKNIARELAQKNPARSASFDIYKRIQKTGLEHEVMGEDFFEGENFDELKSKLYDYIAADGKYMPMTKCLHIGLPEKRLKSLKIIDTPGVNDPIESREAKTYEMLTQCDVAFIVSPSGQFLNEQDISLMDRLSGRAGVQELYLVASQSDSQLYGNLKQEYSGRLPDVLNALLNILAKQAKDSLLSSFPSDSAIYKLAKESEKRLLVTSSVCQTLLEQPEQHWDSTAKHAYKMLHEHYPDYFLSPEQTTIQLNTLSCVEKINNILDIVRTNRDKIIADGLNSFLQTQTEAIEVLQTSLLTYVQQAENLLKNTDKAEIKQQLDTINQVKTKGEMVAKEVFLNSVDTFQLTLPKHLDSIVKDFYNETQDSMRSAEGQATRQIKRSGFLSGCARILGVGGYTDETYTTIQAGVVRNALEEFHSLLQSELEYSVKAESINWRNKLGRDILSAIRKEIGDEHIQHEYITSACRNLINSLTEVEPPNLPGLPDSLKKSGTISGYEQSAFEENARSYMQELKDISKKFTKDVKEQIKRIEKTEFASRLFNTYLERIKLLEEQIAAKDLTLEKYKNMLAEIKDIA